MTGWKIFKLAFCATTGVICASAIYLVIYTLVVAGTIFLFGTR